MVGNEGALWRFPGSVPCAARPPGALRMLGPEDPLVARAFGRERAAKRRTRAYALYADGRVARTESFGCPVLPLSSVDPARASDIAFERDPGRWRNERQIFPAVLNVGLVLDGIVGRMLSVGFGEYSCVTSPLIWIDAERPSGLHDWMDAATRSFRRAFGDVTANYGIGIASWGTCRHCGEALTDEDGWQSWFDFSACDACRSRPSVPAVRRKSPRRVLPAPSDLLPPDANTRAALHAAYGGTCQYCERPVSLERCQVEHIVPASLPLANLVAALVDAGAERGMAEQFVRDLAPPIHDCALNYMLACATCNGRKGDRVVSPMALDLLLRRAKSRAGRVLGERFPF